MNTETVRKNQRHVVSSHKEGIREGYAETTIEMASGRSYRFRFANKKVHLMFTYERTSNHPAEYRVARERAARVLFSFRNTDEGSRSKP